MIHVRPNSPISAPLDELLNNSIVLFCCHFREWSFQITNLNWGIGEDHGYHEPRVKFWCALETVVFFTMLSTRYCSWKLCPGFNDRKCGGFYIRVIKSGKPCDMITRGWSSKNLKIEDNNKVFIPIGFIKDQLSKIEKKNKSPVRIIIWSSKTPIVAGFLAWSSEAAI